MDRDRRLLCQAGLTLAASAAAGCSSMPATNGDMANNAVCSVNAVGVGNASDVALNQVVTHMTPTTSVFICRDAGGLYAMEVRCTHNQCDVNPRSMSDVRQGFVCPCHQSTFDANGEHQTSPAPSPLPHYALCAQPSGALIVDPTMVVPASTRLKL